MKRFLKMVCTGVLIVLAVFVAIVGFLLSAVMGIAVSLAAIGAPFIFAIAVVVSNKVMKKKGPSKQ